MNLLPQRQNQIITITIFRFCLRDLACLSWPASGRSISENCLQDHGWALIPTHGRKANSYPSSLKLEDLEIHGTSSGCWPTPCLQASLAGSSCTHAVVEAVVDTMIWGSSAKRPVSKPEKCRDSQRSGDGLEVPRKLPLSLHVTPILFLKSNRSKTGTHLAWKDFAYNTKSFICFFLNEGRHWRTSSLSVFMS